MEKVITFTNKFGDTIREKVETFDMRGTIMSAKRFEVGSSTLFRLSVEDANGRYGATIWDNAKGYNAQAIKQGLAIHIKGIIREQGYVGSDGMPKTYKEYKVQEIL